MSKKPTVGEINDAARVLARLKDKIFIEEKIDPTTLILLVDRYLVRQDGGTSSGSSIRERGNVVGQLTSDRITIRNFFRLLDVIGTDEVELTVSLKLRNGRRLSVSETSKFIKDEAFVVETSKDRKKRNE